MEQRLKRTIHPGRGILRNKVSEEIYKNAVPATCLHCEKKIKKGDTYIVVRRGKKGSGKISARFCCKDCQQEYEHKVLEERGFYDNQQPLRITRT